MPMIPANNNAIFDMIKAFPANKYKPAIATGTIAAIFIAKPIIIMPIIFFILPRPKNGETEK